MQAFYRGKEFGSRPVFFIYDSYLTPASEWARVLDPKGADTLRHTLYDAAVIGLRVKEDDGKLMT